MTNENNLKISELRGWKLVQTDQNKYGVRFWTLYNSAHKIEYTHPYKDTVEAQFPNWHSDANWPTLLQELPFPELFKTHIGWKCFVAQSFRGTGESPGEAVCIAWLKWKGISV